MIIYSDIIGVLLAGGQSRRMGGGDKGLLELSGKPMIQHVIERLKPQVRALVINANGDPKRFEAYRLPVVADTISGHVGPLAGVLAGMRWAKQNAPEATHIITVPTDAPLLPLELAAKLLSALEDGSGTIALAASDGHKHPVIGLWPVNLADDLECALKDGVRKVLHWADRHGTNIAQFEFISLDGMTIDPFFNANTPEELAQVGTILETQTL